MYFEKLRVSAYVDKRHERWINDRFHLVRRWRKPFYKHWKQDAI